MTFSSSSSAPATDRLLALWNTCPYYRSTGLRLVGADATGSLLRLDVREDHLQAYGTAHGGVIAGLLDAAMALAIIGRLGEREGCSTVEMKVNYLAPVAPGPLDGAGRVVHLGGRLAVATADARDAGGRVVACAQGTFARWGDGG